MMGAWTDCRRLEISCDKAVAEKVPEISVVNFFEILDFLKDYVETISMYHNCYLDVNEPIALYVKIGSYLYKTTQKDVVHLTSIMSTQSMNVKHVMLMCTCDAMLELFKIYTKDGLGVARDLQSLVVDNLVTCMSHVNLNVISSCITHLNLACCFRSIPLVVRLCKLISNLTSIASS